MSTAKPENICEMSVYGYHHSLRCDRIGKYANLMVLWLDAAARAKGTGVFQTAVILGQMYAHTKPKKSRPSDPNLPARAFEASVSQLCMYGVQASTIRKGMKALAKAGLIELQDRPGLPYIIRVLADDDACRPLEVQFQKRLEAESGQRRARTPMKSDAFRSAVEDLLRHNGFIQDDESQAWCKADEVVRVRSAPEGEFRLSFQNAEITTMKRLLRGVESVKVVRRKDKEGRALPTGSWLVGSSTRSAVDLLGQILTTYVPPSDAHGVAS